MKRRKIHEEYHFNHVLQTKIITKHNFTYRNLLGLLTKYLRERKKILDIGCGVGTIDFYLGKMDRNVLGVDISERAIRMATKNAKFFGLKNVFYKQLDFPKEKVKGKFELILATEILEHLPHDSEALIEIYKILDPKKGILIISVPSKNAPLFKMGLLSDFDKKVGHVRRYTLEELLLKLSRINFEILEFKKTEGILRNLLFTNNYAGKFIKFLKWYISDIIGIFDNLTIPLFGESQIYIVAKRK